MLAKAFGYVLKGYASHLVLCPLLNRAKRQAADELLL
ncbi:hypothetical protein AGR1C_pAt40366 [Agrobacterium fabacearum TT111]|nr:hypothetical protein AGR1C_pAt40366 [Agrobacterium fabacearum TT111]